MLDAGSWRLETGDKPAMQKRLRSGVYYRLGTEEGTAIFSFRMAQIGMKIIANS
jgi:hypothetical protein